MYGHSAELCSFFQCFGYLEKEIKTLPNRSKCGARLRLRHRDWVDFQSASTSATSERNGTRANTYTYIYVYSSCVSEALRSVSLISRMHGYLYRETRSHCFLMFINKEKRKKKNSNEMKELLPEQYLGRARERASKESVELFQFQFHLLFVFSVFCSGCSRVICVQNSSRQAGACFKQ